MRCIAAQVLAAAGAAAVAGTTLAQPADGSDEGPVVIEPTKRDWKLFQLRTLRASSKLLGRYTRDSFSQAGEPDRKDEERMFRGVLELDFESAIGHENLIDLTGLVRFGWEDRLLESGTIGGEDHGSDFVDLFDVNARVLGTSRVPVDVYARREEQFLDRAFSTNITSTTLEYGAAANIMSEKAPTTVRVFRLENQQSDGVGGFDYGLTQNSLAINSNILVGDGHRLLLTYALDDVSESQGTLFSDDYLRHDLLLSDTLEVGQTKGQELRSYLRYYAQDGLSDVRILRLDEQLRLVHTPNLESRYVAAAEHQTRQGVDQDSARGSALVKHQLFKSLTSSAGAGGEWISNSEGFSSNTWFLNGSLDYTKKTRGGRVTASAGANFTSTQNGESGGTVNFVDEPHVFIDPQPIIVSRPNIEQGSVVVTAVGGVPTYQEGFDYTVDYFRDRIEVRVVVGRGIVDGQTVLMDYSTRAGGGETVDSLSTTTTVRYTVTEGSLRGLSAYAMLRTLNYQVDAATPASIVLDDGFDTTLGLEFRRGGFMVLAEREDRATSQNPYVLMRLRATFDYVFSLRSAVGLEGTYETTDFSELDNSLRYARASAWWKRFYGSDLEFMARLDLRDEHDDLRGASTGIDQYLSVHWRRRQTSVSAALRATWFESGDSDRESLFLELGFRRDF